jgi:hypothetical protein
LPFLIGQIADGFRRRNLGGQGEQHALHLTHDLVLFQVLSTPPASVFGSSIVHRGTARRAFEYCPPPFFLSSIVHGGVAFLTTCRMIHHRKANE